MVAEVNRLIADLLAAGQAVAFPGVGSLIPVRRAAHRISKREMMPPTRAIDFSSELQGKTLAEQIARAAGCSLEQAEEIYGRWLGHTYQDEVLTLEGIGILRQKHLTLEEAFDERLNPAGRKPMAVRRRRRPDWMLWVGIVAILIAGGIGYYGYTKIYRTMGERTEQQQTEVVVPTEPQEITLAAETESAAEAQQETPSEAVAVPNVAEKPAPVQPTKPVEQEQPEVGVMNMQSGFYYVILGVYSSPENAKRAVEQAAEKDETMRCGVYRFGSKWMVSPFESEDHEAANLFRKAHAEQFPELWIRKAN